MSESKASGFWAWAHRGDLKTHALHYAQAQFLMMPLGFLIGWITLALNPWVVPVSALGFLLGSVIIIAVFTHKELGDIALALFGMVWPAGRYEDRRAAQTVFTAKLVDGLGDWWSPFLAIPLTALVLSYFGG